MAKLPKRRAAVTPEPESPRGRVDVLLLRIGEVLTRRVERGLAGAGVTVNLWDGADGVRSVVERFCDEQNLTGFVASPASVAQRAGLLKRRGVGKRVKG